MEIICHFKDMREYGDLVPEAKKTKLGRYHGSYYPIDGFGVTCWAVGAYLVVPEYNKYIEQELTDEQIVEACLEYLNKPPPRKKYQRRVSQPLYGTLSLHRCRSKVPAEENEGNQCYEVLLFTDRRKNKHFWSEGQINYAPRKRKRKKAKK